MIRDVNFFWRGVGAKGAGTWWCHIGYLNNLAGPILAKRCSICWGSCSICLLMSTVVGGTHVYHVMRLASSTFTWRSDHRGKWQPPWQMFSSPGERAMGDLYGQVAGICIVSNNCYNMCLPQRTLKTRSQSSQVVSKITSLLMGKKVWLSKKLQNHHQNHFSSHRHEW